MKKVSALLAGFAILAGTGLTQVATDPAGDTINANGVCDLTALYVSYTATDVTFAVDTVGSQVAADWGKYMFYIETDNAASPTAPTGNGNGWGRPINPDDTTFDPKYWVAAWVDGGNGAEVYSHVGGGTGTFGTGNHWSKDAATYFPTPGLSVSKTTNQVSVTVPKSSIGNPNTVRVVAMSSGGGGGDTAVDTIPSVSDPTGWSDAVTRGSAAGPTTVPVELDAYDVE